MQQKKHRKTHQVNGEKIFVTRHIGDHWMVRSPGLFAHHLNRSQAEKLVRDLNRVIRETFFPKKKGGAFSRRKGHTFEREVVKLVKHVFPKARRQLEFQKDCALGVDLAETGRFRFQCKKLKTYASVNTIKEIQHEPLLGEVPVLVTAGDNEPPMAVLPLADLLDLLMVAETGVPVPGDREKFEAELEGL